MRSEYEVAVSELCKDHPKVVSMAFVEWWLLKYGNLYRQMSSYFHFPYPYLNIPETLKSEMHFSSVFRELTRFSEIHRNETTAKQALEEYSGLKDNKLSLTNIELINWYLKYEKLGCYSTMGLFVFYANPLSEAFEDIPIEYTVISISCEDFKSLKKMFDLYADYCDNPQYFKPVKN